MGCGVGIDTLHLIESGYNVIASDFSPIALKKIKTNIPEAEIMQFNMKNGMPFENDIQQQKNCNKRCR